MGHSAIADILREPVLVQEKVDGSQFSFAALPDSGSESFELHMRSKGAIVRAEAPGMFAPAVATVTALFDAGRLVPGWIYRGEFLGRPKHNVLAYDRVPRGNIILFDVENLSDGPQHFLSADDVGRVADALGLESVPVFGERLIDSIGALRELLTEVSCLGGQQIEGIVVKNYHRFCPDGKVQMGKFVSERFKEVHAREWKTANPGTGDVLGQIITSLRTEARWDKAVIHLRERGELEGSPRDIGPLIRDVQADVEAEEEDFIKTKLYDYALPHIRRGVVRGLPEYYKERLAEQAFAPVAEAA